MSKKTIADYIIYEWQEAQFLEKTEVILSLVNVCGIHKILRQSSNPVYLVPESFYQSAKTTTKQQER